MIFGIVAGTVVASQRSDEIKGAKYLLLEICSADGKGKGSFIVSLDTFGAGPGEMVLLSQGSSTRQTALTRNKAVDAVVVGIVDLVQTGGRLVYRKSV
ncbi:MAG: EutN/CcmL family microcompartment protein [Spirochaetales bacterium]|nr:EutN/CcmL family microcompartment protein [Spirochaetales bacterium]